MRSRYTAPIVGAIAILLVVGLLFWGIVGYWQDADDRFWQWLTESFWGRGLFPNGWNLFGMSPWAYLLIGISAGVVAFFKWERTGYSSSHWGRDLAPMKTGNSVVAYVAAGLSALLIVSSVVIWFASLDDRSQSYESDTRFVVADQDQLNTNLQRLDSQFIDEGTYSQAWEPRAASATGAKTVMKRTSSSDSGNQLLLDTMTYTYGTTPGWTAIRDGKKKQPLYGVAFWPGQGNVSTCRFTGDYNLTKSLHGKMGNNLLDEIAAYNKSLFFDEQDMWGYCKPAGDPNKVDDDQPVLVIPVKTWDGYGHRTTWYSGGVLTITGSSSGKAQIQHIDNVTPNQFPGPVYSISLAANQRQETQWMAGKWNKWFRDFGYATTDVESQAGNTSEFLLKSKSDGRLYWVTPLTARGSDSQLVTAYSLIRADKATSGKFNGLRIYVLASDDPRIVNLDDLEARTRQAISEEDSGFFAAKGKLVEFLPLDDKNWQVYAELGGRVVYRITVPADSRIRPKVTSLDGIDETPVEEDTDPVSPNQGGVTGSACVAELNKLSDAQLATCLTDIASELQRRQKK